MSDSPADDPVDPRPPSSYSLVLPAGWCRLPVRNGAAEAVSALVDRVTADIPRDRAAAYRGELRKMLDEQVLAARRTGGLDLYLPIAPVGGRPTAASFVVSHVAPDDGPMPDGGDVSVVAELLEDGGSDAEPVELAGATGVRLQRVEEPAAEPADGALDRAARHVDYVVPVPGGAGWLVVAFSTPLLLDSDAPVSTDGSLRFDDVLVELFDAIVSTLQWRT